jgi:TonB-dependent SusC/RagA subfamily outer membrane receptor
VYIDNSNFDPADEFTNEPDFGNAAMDINPRNIKSITVLKGPNAAALYGARAANGVVLIETKDGTESIQEGIGIDVTSSVLFQDILVLPDMQNEYGQGCGGEFRYVDGAGSGLCDGTDESWGPRLTDE